MGASGRATGYVGASGQWGTMRRPVSSAAAHPRQSGRGDADPSVGHRMGRGRWAARHPTGAARHPPRGRRAHPAAVGHGPTGRQARLDDALGHTAWAVLSTAPAGGRADLERWRRASVQVLQLRHAGSDPGPGAVVDVQNQLRDWMRSRHVTAMAVRPDSIDTPTRRQANSLRRPPRPRCRPRNESRPSPRFPLRSPPCPRSRSYSRIAGSSPPFPRPPSGAAGRGQRPTGRAGHARAYATEPARSVHSQQRAGRGYRRISTRFFRAARKNLPVSGQTRGNAEQSPCCCVGAVAANNARSASPQITVATPLPASHSRHQFPKA
jgi:hypothetical protein